MTSSGAEPPLKLLALDGGGIRGLSELLMLKEIMHRLMVEENERRKKDVEEPLSRLPKPCDYFDLIGGTSTGGIIALMLGRLRMDVDTAIKHYDDLAKQVFSGIKRWGDGKFSATKLEGAIKSVVRTVTGDSESLLLEDDNAGVCRTFVCAKNAHNLNANIPVLFRTYRSRETHSNCKIWEAARATSAAPAFFKRIEISPQQPFIDGGLGRNNPSQVVLDEAKALFGARQIGCLVSIGTGQAEVIGIKKPGLFQQIIPTDIIEALKTISTDCEATHEAMLDRFANSPNTYFRLNVEQGMQRIELSEWEKLSNVEAHTAQYMKKKEVDEKLAVLVNAIRVPRAQFMIELGTKQVLGAKNPSTLMGMANLVSMYKNQGHWTEAEALQVVVMEKAKQMLGSDHPDTLKYMGDLADIYSSQGCWREAEALQVVVIEKRKQVLGNDHPYTLMSMANLAGTYSSQGRWTEAEALQVVVMEKTKQILGADHPDTLTSMGNLADIYSSQGRWREAEALQVVVMENRKHILGDEHPDTLTCIGHLADIYSHQGRWTEAEALQVVVMEKTKQILGADHPDTLTSMRNLADTNQGHKYLKEKTKQVLGDPIIDIPEIPPSPLSHEIALYPVEYLENIPEAAPTPVVHEINLFSVEFLSGGIPESSEVGMHTVQAELRDEEI
ncbi:hypothetical protein GALMADRAFT_257519 [Galerina marginata CBS 339.88]|uniref:PNPLA domain-containing protein n=1 Tax=Galerina marginata (strain CBS 339.88) TaxID=685588 RepID=A0A067SJW1_GALM3|nr:hypothetical protein GALMADRAFT_257519 [Galerina marginata CBS 339.88]